jgi:hypothetical protein
VSDSSSMVPCPARLGCGWTQHGRKHFPHPGLTREHTKNGSPAKYLPGTTPEQIQTIETATVRAPDNVLSTPPAKAEYARSTGKVIGWDRGEDATVSFAECSGGATAGRAYHGRPMAIDNRKLKEAGSWLPGTR